MNEAERIGEQLRRAFDGEAWHGPAVQEVLHGVTPAQAAQRPIPSAHTIWEIARHIAAWETIARRRLAGEPLVSVPDGQDWPPVTDSSEAAWKKTLENLKDSHQQLRRAIAGLSEARLEEKVPGHNYDFYAMLHGVVQHDLYHAGQIALLKKALT